MHTIFTFRAIIRSLSVFGLWGWVDLIGDLLVVVGCLGESWMLLNRFSKQMEAQGKRLGGVWRLLAFLEAKVRLVCVRLNIAGRKLSESKEHLLEALFVMLVAFGVGLELLSLPFSLLESARVGGDAADAKLFAAKVGTTNAQLVAENLVLRSNLVALEIKLQPRIITPQQIENFIFLTEKVSKVPIKICVGMNGPTSYAGQLRDMFTRARFGIDSSVNSTIGITYSFDRTFVRPPGELFEWPHILIARYGTNHLKTGTVQMSGFTFENTNGFIRPIAVNSNDQNEIFMSLYAVFKQVDIPAVVVNDDVWVKPGEIAILVPSKSD
jgi:hypothetical protein